jgi:hypothetical protein
MIRPHATAVDAYFATAQEAVEAALRDSWQFLAQEVVDALPCPFVIDPHFPHSRALPGNRFA